MPEWIPDQAARQELMQRLRDKYTEDRTQELHWTEVRNCLTKMWEDKHDPLPPTDQEMLLFAVGFGLEAVILRDEQVMMNDDTGDLGMLSSMSPPPRIMFGLHLTPDYQQIKGGELDLKSTRMHPDTDGSPKRGWPGTWTHQFIGYAVSNILPAGIQESDGWENLIPEYVFYNVGIMYITFPVEFAALNIKFSREEVIKVIDNALERKAIYLRHVKEDRKPTPFRWNEDYECEHCRYSFRCNATPRTRARKE